MHKSRHFTSQAEEDAIKVLEEFLHNRLPFYQRFHNHVQPQKGVVNG